MARRGRSRLLAQLNEPQREAVLHDDGALLVLAGAGSGKTRVIIHRIARLLEDGVAPEQICAVTFTNKAAREMRERLSALAGRSAEGVHLSTFHSLGLRILRDELKAAGLRRGFCIYDTADQLSLVRDLMRQVKVAERRLDPGRLLERILGAKRQGLAEIPLRFNDEYEEAAHALYHKYLEQMRAFNAVDFDDLVLRARAVLSRKGPAQRWGKRFLHLLVDEYQDTSPDQLELLQALAKGARTVCAVGDDDQSIYAWRGAAADSILGFSKHFSGAREVVLDQNYRSTSHILNGANSVIQHNTQRKTKNLWSALGDGEPVQVVACTDAEDEATFVCTTIGQLLQDGVEARDIAVLYRANAQSRLIEEGLALDKVPFRVLGGQAFHERKEVRDAHAFLTVVQNPWDEIALRRIVNVPPRGIGPGSIERLVAYGETKGKGLWWALQNASKVPDLPQAAVAGAASLTRVLNPVSRGLGSTSASQLGEQVRRMLDALGLREAIHQADDAPGLAERRIENLDEVVNGVTRFGQSHPDSRAPLADYLSGVALAAHRDQDDGHGANSVTLMTLHGAKGLEFKCVLLIGVEEGLLPHRRTLDGDGELDEERRLCYVGMTRARQRLWLTWARTRLNRGRPLRRTPSRYLQELPESEGVARRDRGQPLQGDEGERVAQDFFARMRAQLGEDLEAEL